MGHSSIRIKVRRKKVAHFSSQLRLNTVRNNTIPPHKEANKCTYTKHPQPKNLTKKEIAAIFAAKKKQLWNDLSKDEKMAAYIEDKMKKWEKEFPCPVKTSDIQQDIFEQEYLPQWKEDYNRKKEAVKAEIKSRFNKVKLFGRFEISPHEYNDELIAEIKDKYNEGHDVNKIDKTAKLVQKAQKIVTCCWKKRKNMTCATLKSYDSNTGRVLIPEKKAA